MKTDYRIDIDGLRAIAVLSVIIYHLNENWIPGGFIGVDIFFVISGFLISRHIFSSIENQNFSFQEFYRKRINRILPAMYGVIAFTTILGILFLLPEDLYALAQSAINALKFISNIYFARDNDYFAPDAIEKPLLNLWSLSVEEQFYLLLPPILIFVWAKLGARLKILLIPSLIFLSLAFSEYQLIQGSSKDAYYSVASRAFELLIGVWLANVRIRIDKKWLADLLAFVGLILIVVAMFFLSAKSRFPGMSALIPCLGASFLIIAGEHRRAFVSKILSIKPLVFIGVISYSLYLYHWPILAFLRYLGFGHNFGLQAAAPILLVVFILATLSWRFVETPFRRNSPSFRKVFLIRFLGPSALGVVALTLVAKYRDFPSRINHYDRLVQAQKFVYDSYCHNRFDEENYSTCKFGDAKAHDRILLIGDSTAGHYQPTLDALGKKLKFAFVSRSFGSCYPVIRTQGNVLDITSDEECTRQIDWNSRVVDEFDTFILSARWSWYPLDKYGGHLKETITHLKDQGKRVILLEQIPDCPDIPKFYRRNFAPVSALVDLDIYSTVTMSCGRESGPANKAIAEIASETGATFLILPTMYQEFGNLPIDGDYYYYKDRDHLNMSGAFRIGDVLAEQFPQLRTTIVGP